MNIHLLGRFQVEYQGQPVDELNTPRLQALLAYLLLQRGRPLARERIAGDLWPEVGESNGRNNLRRLLHRLRQLLPEADRYLEITPQTLRWRDEAPLTLDVAEFETAVAQAAGPAGWERALAHYGGPLLPELYDDWLLPFQEQVYQLWLEGLVHAAEAAEAARAWELAVRCAGRLVELEPLHEEYVRLLMRLHAQQGDFTAALRVYNQSAAVLREALGIPPSRPTRDLHTQILAALDGDQVDLPAASFEPLLPPATLPVYLTPFVGREAELEQLVALFGAENRRLVLVTGPGGSGKTRLAVECAHAFSRRDGAGVVFIPLAAVQDEVALFSAVAGALGVTLAGQQDPAGQLVSILSEQERLLVFDNVEHLLAEARRLIRAILEKAAGCRLLVTSRERLNLPGERLLELGGLSFPADLPLEETAARLPAFPAPQLFLKLARQQRPDYRPTPLDWLAIYEICRLTGGLPLAIELVTPWLRLLSCAEIARRLRLNLDLLEDNGQQGEGLERQRSVQASLAYSWDMLGEGEQRLLGRLAIFRGPFTPLAAEVVAESRIGELRQLLDRSLLQSSAAGLFYLHPLLRQFLRARHPGSSAEQAAVRGRHTDYYARRLVAAAADLRRSQQVGERPEPILRELLAEIDNYRSAADHLLAGSPLVDSGGSGEMRSFVEAYGLLLQYEGWFEEGVRLYERYLDGHPGLPLLEAARLRRQLAEFYLSLGDIAAGERLFQKALIDLGGRPPPPGGRLAVALLGQLLGQGVRRLFPAAAGGAPAGSEEEGRRVEMAKIYDQLARIHFVNGRRLRSAFCGLAALNQAEKTANLGLQARGYGQAAVAMGLAGRHRPAAGYYERAQRTLPDIGDALERAYVLRALGAYDLVVARWGPAARQLEEAIKIYEQVGKIQLWGECYTALNQVEIAQGNYRRSLKLWAELSRVARRSGNAFQEVWALNGRGSCLLFLGETEEAITHLERGLKRVDELDYAPGRITARSMLAVAFLRAGDLARALALAAETREIGRQDPPPLITVVLAQANVAEVYIHLLRLSPAERERLGPEASRSGERAREAVRLLNRLTRAYRAGRPRALLCAGLLERETGREGRATKYFRAAAGLAAGLNMPYEEGRAYLELGRRLSAVDPQRTDLLRKARSCFERIDARFHLEQLALLEARLDQS